MHRNLSLLFVFLLALAAWLVPADPATAAKKADVANTRHNLSKTGPGTVKATTETQICVFCHTPHAAETLLGAPLWNRRLQSATYTTYESASIEASLAELQAGPGGLSRLCLSCHDGALALGSVNVANGQSNPTIALTGTPDGKMIAGSGTTTGFTRNLGMDLSNDHPISFTYDATLATADGELRAPDGTIVGTRRVGQPKPKLPLEDGKMQCTTCHDPHLREMDPAEAVAKFLRLNRLQKEQPVGGSFSEANDIFCLACHDKGGQLWALSAHANKQVADEQFKGAAATQREFPANLPVWRAACLSCHDTHTVQGARRLLREGTDSALSPKAGGKSAIEETCYQCHTNTTDTALNIANNDNVPNIKTDFSTSTNKRMPITLADQMVTAEAHDIGTGTGSQRGKDFVEAPARLGKGDLANRHVECTDCHNPHRVIKNRKFNDNPTSPVLASHGGTHNHAAGHTNIASGVLKGITGVEPTGWTAVAFGSKASGFDLKRGDGGVGASEAAGSAWVTREYQVCLKCHSNYAYDNPPALGSTAGGTASGTNGLLYYTDQAMEFQAPSGHSGSPASTNDGGASSNYQTMNHRSWHPVLASTGRTLGTRGISGTSPWLSPWNAVADVGTQTMYCSDCHGSNTAAGTVAPTDANPWGPHGSSNDFILKGTWSNNSGTPDSSTVLCLKCHDSSVYASTSPNGAQNTGFWNPDSSVPGGNGRGNLHNYHANKISGGVRCTWCHVAVPHGWKNRSFLVNLNDVGPEAGLAVGTQVRNGTTTAYNKPPYYLRAVLKIRTFGNRGSWIASDCGSRGAPGNGASGRNWMRDSSENCANAP